MSAAPRSAYVDIAGSFGRELAAKGQREMTAFAIDWLDKLFGADVKKAVKRTHATQWAFAPYVHGRVLGRRARRPAVAPHPDGADLRDRVFTPARPRTRRCGARSAAPGNPASARPISALKVLGTAAGSARPEAHRSSAEATGAAAAERRRARQDNAVGVPRISN